MRKTHIVRGKKTTRPDGSAAVAFTGHCRCPSRCFCKFDAADLVAIGYWKLRQRIPMVELMRDARSRQEREAVCVVSMLDLDNVVAEIMIREHMAGATCDVMACRDDLRNRPLKAMRTYQPERDHGRSHSRRTTRIPTSRRAGKKL